MNGEIINMVVVTGNVVTHQPGQLDARDHLDTVKAVYEMLAEVFDESFIFGVIGSDDTYPQGYYPFEDRSTLPFVLPKTPEKAQY